MLFNRLNLYPSNTQRDFALVHSGQFFQRNDALFVKFYAGGKEGGLCVATFDSKIQVGHTLFLMDGDLVTSYVQDASVGDTMSAEVTGIGD